MIQLSIKSSFKQTISHYKIPNNLCLTTLYTDSIIPCLFMSYALNISLYVLELEIHFLCNHEYQRLIEDLNNLTKLPYNKLRLNRQREKLPALNHYTVVYSRQQTHNRIINNSLRAIASRRIFIVSSVCNKTLSSHLLNEATLMRIIYCYVGNYINKKIDILPEA